MDLLVYFVKLMNSMSTIYLTTVNILVVTITQRICLFLGLIRGSVNFVGRAVDRVINTFGRVEDRLRALLEEFRGIILRGIPELNIPVLDPLHVNKVEFDVNHDSAK